jgi:PAS domain S-box-containing protein
MSTEKKGLTLSKGLVARPTVLLGNSLAKEERNKLADAIFHVIDRMDIAMVQIDLDYRIVNYNRKALDIYGDIQLGDFCYHMAGKRNTVCDVCPAEEVFSGKESGRSEHRRITASGEEVYIEHFATAIKDDAGNTIGAITFIFDITDRKRQEMELRTHRDDLEKIVKERTRELEAREKALNRTVLELEAIMDALPGMVSVVDREFNTIVANKAIFERFGGTDRAGVIGRKCYEVRKCLDRVCPQCAVARTFETGEPVSRFSTPAEEEFMGISTKSYAAPLKDESGEIWGGVEVIMDVSDLKRQEKALREKEERLLQEISRRRLTENALRQSEERLDLALSGANEGIWDWNLEVNTLHFDSRYYTLAGYEPNDFPGAFEEWRKRVHPDDIQQALSAIDQYLSGEKKTFDIEFRFLRKEGSYMWIQGRGKIVSRDERGKPIRFVGTHSDITVRKKIEESLRITQFSFDKANIGIYRIAPNAQIQEVNEKAAQMLGYTKEEMSRLTIMDIDPPVTPESWVPIWENLLDKKLDIFERVHRRKDGSQLPVEINSNLLEHDDRKYSIAFVQDISERKRAEEELKHLRNYLTNIIDSMPSVLVGVDAEGGVTQWNKQAERATGLAAGEAVAQPLGSVFPRLAQEMDRIHKAIRDREVIRKPKIPYYEEGAIRYEDLTIFPLVANGVEGAVIRVDDVTERVRLEEMMIQSEKMLSVGGLAAGMAHEINNPLAGILQNAAVLESRLLEELPANVRAAEAAGFTMTALRRYLEARGLIGMLENICISGDRAAAIVKNMLSFARKSDRAVSSHDLGSLLDQTVELVQTDYDMKKHYDFKQIRIAREYDRSAPPVPCEASKLQQVFMNILKNGAEAMVDGGDARPQPSFILRVKEAGPWVRVEIEDNGPGMDETVRRRVFEPFFTTKPVGEGTGLGLSVSYFIISENHGGEMRVYSEKDSGTRFVIHLPKEGKKVF